jgi:hypothetical protein
MSRTHLTTSFRRYDNSFRLFWTSQDIALGPALLAIVADINYSKVLPIHDLLQYLFPLKHKHQVQDHCLKCHLPNANIFYLSAIPGFIILVGLYVAVHCRAHSRAASVAESSNVAGKNAALIGSPRLDDTSSSMPSSVGLVSKLDDRHDQVQVQVRAVLHVTNHDRSTNKNKITHPKSWRQVQPASVPQGLATGFGGGHRRTGSRESETTMHRRTGSRDCEAAAAAAMAFSIHRRAGSRDVLDAGSIATVSESSLGWSVDVVSAGAGTGNSTC